MVLSIRECQIKRSGHNVEVMSPLIGRAELRVRVSSFVGANDVVADLWRLSEHYRLVLPGDISGRVISCKDHDRVIKLNYGDVFLVLDEAPLDSRAKPEAIVKEADNSIPITSPMDGMFYLSSSPECEAFVKVGDEIEPGQTIGLIEVMKSFYPLKFDGEKTKTVASIAVKNGQPISIGTVLFRVK